MFEKIIKIKKRRQEFANRQAGMTYIELIVVLSIFSVMTAIVLTNYGAFQAKVDIKNLGNDIALKIVQAQKSAMSGALTSLVPSVNPWKPDYGVSFKVGTSFVYFVDLNMDGLYQSTTTCGGECIENISITKGDSISRIDGCSGSDTSTCTGELNGNDLTVSFRRPDSSAIISSGGAVYPSSTFDHYQIVVISPHSTATARIAVYPSGRIQVN